MKDKKKKKTEFEFSAGGVVKKDREILLIKTKDLKQKDVWTFPKGKIEKGESSSQAAIREVREETGYRCSIDSELEEVKYFFKRKGSLVIKKVKWFLMSPVKKEDSPNFEVEKIKWADYTTSKELLKYKSDLKILKKVFKK
ncbi:MAG: NUDIX hydrolase [Elusimicrobiota bacterium]